MKARVGPVDEVGKHTACGVLTVIGNLSAPSPNLPATGGGGMGRLDKRYAPPEAIYKEPIRGPR